MRKLYRVISIALLVSPTFAGVTFEDSSIVLPTYAPGGYDKTPLFYTGRVYQGAQGRVYPYPMQDVLHDEKADETYKYLALKNDWLEMGILPEHGGHLLNLTDRQTGFETFYRQHVIKPALIGMLGAWISGGVEWNFPHHHRATTAMPIDWRHESNDDGSETIWIGETELRRRLKWTIGLSMMPDRAVLQAENRFMNRQPWIETMIYWANVSVHCGDDYQILFPPSCHLGFDHHKNYWTSFPIGPRKEAHDLIPSQRSKYADDISGTMDLSWWRNFTIESRSIFAMDPDNAWLAGFDHKKRCGTAHVSNRHITVGKKFFLWGNFPEAHVWDTVLTDHDGPYLELMVGCWSDNQPDYSWIAPYETRIVKQFWFPVKGIGGVKNVTVDGAVNLERRGSDEMLMGFFSTRVLKGCMITLYKGKDVVFEEKGVALDPNTPWCKPVKVDADAKDQQYTAAIADANGKVFLSYTPVPEDPHDPLPDVVANPKPPTEYTSAELAFLVGQRLEQFHNGLIDPIPYYKRALEIDPDYSQANLAMGVRLGKNGAFTEAEGYLRKAVDRVTQNYTRAKDAEPEYYLALCCRHLGKLKEAEDLFWRCTWRLTHKKESYVEIARLAALRGDWTEALARIGDALVLGQDEAKLWTLKGVFLKKLGRLDAAKSCFGKAVNCDPLEYWGRYELEGFSSVEKNRGIKAQQLMEAVCDYFGIGAWDEVIALCDAALAKAAAEKPYALEGALPLKETLAACDSYRNPMFAYFAAYAQERLKGEKVEKLKGGEVEKIDWIYCFPSRLEELEVLQWAAANLKPDADTQYFLGEILWNMDQKEAALAAWKKAVELNPKHALALRCIGFGLSHPGTYFTNTGVPTGIANREAYDYYLKSLEADPTNFRTLNECDKLAEKLKIPAAERIATMLKYRTTAEKYDDNVLRLAYLHNAVCEYKPAYDILTTRRFHVWEGSEGLLAPFVEACIGLGREAMKKKDFKTALKFFEESTTYPANLQAGRPGDAGTEPKSRYFMAQCKKALGDAAGYKAELENSLKGWIKAGEMDYWRVKALRELGRDAECAPLIAELKQAIVELEAPVPTVISAYAKFGGENSPMERAEKAREQAGALRRLLEEIEIQPSDGGRALLEEVMRAVDSAIVLATNNELKGFRPAGRLECKDGALSTDKTRFVRSYFDQDVFPVGFSRQSVDGGCVCLAHFERQSQDVWVLWRPDVSSAVATTVDLGSSCMRDPVIVDLCSGFIGDLSTSGLIDKGAGKTVVRNLRLGVVPLMIAANGQVPRQVVWQEMTPAEIVDSIYRPHDLAGGWIGEALPIEMDVSAEPWAAMKTADFLPCFDRYGQFKWRDWPGKTHSDDELKAAAKTEETDLAAHPGPEGRDRFGGWAAGPKLKATGRFYTTKLQGKWWLVDPDGHLFWSWGPVRVTPSSAMTPLNGNPRTPKCGGPLPDRDCLFEGLPRPGEPLAKFYETFDEMLRQAYADRGETRHFDFSGANLCRKYGSDWYARFADVCHRRLRSWGCNTIANSSDREICLQDRTPYAERIVCQSRPIAASWGPWARFRDPFDPSFTEGCRQALADHGGEAHDPWCIGFFVDNEIQWGKTHEDLARWTLWSPSDQPARIEFMKCLAAKGIVYDAAKGPDSVPAEELRNFTDVLVEEYFRRTRETVKAYDPGLLYLGCRFAMSAKPWTIRACVKYCDVVSYNIYAMTVGDWRLPQDLDAPVMIGEFHFGAHDRGLFGAGLVNAGSQTARAAALIAYVKSALANPQIVGVHWHQYSDQATSGRFDGECFQVGWTDVCDRPYAETVSALRALDIYRERGSTEF